MEEDFKLLLFFGCLGDGSIYLPHECKQYRYDFSQIENHKDSVDQRLKMFLPYINARLSYVKQCHRQRQNRWSMYTKTHKIISVVHEDLYTPKKYIPENYIKQINWLGLSLWYMDDGNLDIQRNGKKISACLSTDGFTYQDCELACFYIKKNLGVDFHIHKAKVNKVGQQTYRLRTVKNSYQEFNNGICDYVVPSFYYKLSVREAPNKYIRMKIQSDLISNNENLAEMSNPAILAE